MPFSSVGIGVHEDDKHSGSAKRAGALGVAPLDAGSKVPAGNLPSLDGGNGHIFVAPYNYSAIIQGTWVITIATNQVNNYLFDNSTTGALNDQVDYKVFLSAGTYTFRRIGYRDNYAGIITLLIDGSSAGTVDLYNAGGLNNASSDIANIVVATSGLKTLSIKIASKNGSSNAYRNLMGGLVMFRTA